MLELKRIIDPFTFTPIINLVDGEKVLVQITEVAFGGAAQSFSPLYNMCENMKKIISERLEQHIKLL